MTEQDPFEPPPVTVIWPDGQTQNGVLHARHQVPGNWLFLVAVTLWHANENGLVEPVVYRTWVEAPAHVRPVEGASYDSVPARKLPPSAPPLPVSDPGRPRGWVLQRLPSPAPARPGPARPGPARGILHAPDCTEAPRDVPTLSLNTALDTADKPGTLLCTLCSAAGELDPLLRGFDHIQDD
ncbi:DUF6233 domain-containing protein [Streptomyces violascens]|uniref:Uncharacterized protein n=1 Tax=Streptomyces violascens TaxID=67381 RepID=A0ABQ3QS57_9ACTN|nr:DUF6233 domain-containing protein [Streptomyces violascens]GGU51393.1 hypothetical protein GCM10010289_84690 [Streptomyces violascens]GHI40080.1 hypothetical protein Sviol_44880 [Streptomyces violascens]